VIRWIYYPNSTKPDSFVISIINEFRKVEDDIDSNKKDIQVSDVVLSVIRSGLESLGFRVEKGKKKDEKILVPVLFGLNGQVTKQFEADAFNPERKWVIEVEAGRAYTNYQFLKDYFQASVMFGVDYLGIAVRNTYRGRDDFQKVKEFFDTLYASQKMSHTLKGVLLIGY
jgi:hypothetical protein